MNIFEYQDFCRTTAIYPKEVEREYLTLGLCSEAGEVAGKFKKLIRDTDGTIDAMVAVDIAKELGDNLWYIARLSDYIGWDLQDIIDLNVVKLSERKEKDTLAGSGDNR